MELADTLFPDITALQGGTVPGAKASADVDEKKMTKEQANAPRTVPLVRVWPDAYPAGLAYADTLKYEDFVHRLQVEFKFPLQDAIDFTQFLLRTKAIDFATIADPQPWGGKDYGPDFHGNQYTGGIGGSYQQASSAYHQHGGAIDKPSGKPAIDQPLRISYSHPEQVAKIEQALAATKTSQQDFDEKPGLKNGYDPERATQQQALVGRLLAQADGVPNEHLAVVMGGEGGAGKDYALAQVGKDFGVEHNPDGSVKNFLVLDPDIIKAEMIASGMAVVPPGMTAMQAVGLIHDESITISKDLAQQAMAMGKNVLWNITMNHGDQAPNRIAALRANGYTKANTSTVFIHVPHDVALNRQVQRFESGGRYIPIKDFTPQNAVNFEAVRARGSVSRVYDNTGTTPVLVSRRNH